MAEVRVLFELLKRGYDVVKPHGDRLAFDLGVVVGSRCVRLQIKRAYPVRNSWAVDPRRHLTNRKHHKVKKYEAGAFDLLIVWIPGSDAIFVVPQALVLAATSTMYFKADPGSSARVARTDSYRARWDLLDEALKS